MDKDGNTLWTYNTPNNDYCMLLTIGDVDLDGDNEILVSWRLEDHMVTLIKHDGTKLWDYDFGSGVYARAVAIGHLRDDYAGRECVCGGDGGKLLLLDKDGNKIWEKTLETDHWNDTVQSAVIADVNGDGDNDIVVVIGTSIRAFNNAGTQLWSTDLSDHGVSTVYYVATGTLDGLNPSPHFVVAAAPGRVVAVDKNGNVLWSWATSDPCYSVLLEDVNADGLGEVVVGSGNHGTENPAGGSWYGYVYVLDNLGSPPVLATFETPSSVKALAYGDADNDGNDEIIASCDDGNVYIIDVSTTC